MISTKGRYALRVMIDICEQGECGNIPLKDIAERQGISKKYLEILMRDLVRAGLVRASSGRGGGYSLTRSPADYKVGEIIECMEGSLATVACLAEGASPCPREADCKTLPLWREHDAMVRDFLYGKSLADLLE